jgi:arginyl-tRNA synthetase
LHLHSGLKDIVKKASVSTAAKLGIKSIPEAFLDIPKDKRHGELSANIAMQICKQNKGLNPLKVADQIADKIRQEVNSSKELAPAIGKVEVKPPGFINFYFSKHYLQTAIKEIKREGKNFGRGSIGSSKKVLVEFVSANPTGPLSVAHGRQAAVGDALANILEFAGFKVKREYYLNDEGNQIILLGRSIHARYCELLGEEQAFPEDGYRGQYIYDIAKSMLERYKASLVKLDEKNINKFCQFGIEYIMDVIKKELADFGVRFDNYFSQHQLTRSHKIEETLERLKKKALIYEKDGALWFKSTAFGDDKDRVVKKSDSSYTYLAPDIAYHDDKFKRGFEWLIDLWGPDHHGYIPRIKAAVQALGRDKDSISLLIIQLATLSRGGRPVAMSTRQGEFITLREVMDEVGKDVARFFFLFRRKDSHLEFDLELAKKESMENPVYYIQYAHARICGILEYKDKNIESALSETAKLELLDREEELAILRALREFPRIIEWSAENLEPHRLILYLMDLASSFHLFYTRHRVVSDDRELTAARLQLVEALKTVFSESLTLLGVSCPEKM